MGKYCLEKRNIPSPCETFFITSEICSSQLKNLSTITPRYFVSSTMETLSSPTVKEGFATLSSLMSFSRFLLPITKLCVLATLRDNLLACNQDFYGGPQVSRQNILSRNKTFFLTVKLFFSRQNFLSHGKTLFLTAKLSFSRQNSLSHGKALFLTEKLSFSRQNFLPHGKTFFFTAKLSFSWPNFCLHCMTLPEQDVISFITHEGAQQCLPALDRFWKLLVCLP